ncbi:MAG: hypothetical protein F6J87_25935 [Spirulina sp. SIO3F2]|nr:hypothetical protein [Spirulina sp. SIO3F2]
MLLMAGLSVSALWLATPAFAHHPFGGTTPASFMEGILSGLGHPVIGIDHLLFTIATGLLAARVTKGFVIPIAFVLASVLGTGIHLQSWDLPVPEIIVSLSVALFGLLLALRRCPAVPLLAGMAAFAGVFHGYAYGEAIVGAEMSPLVGYLLGFTGIQLAIALGSYTLARQLVAPDAQNSALPQLNLRFSGFAILGAGSAFLSSLLLG